MLHFKHEVLGDSGARVLPTLCGGRWAVCCRVWTWNGAVCVPGTENVGIRVTSKVNYSLTYRCPCLPGPLGHPTCHLRPWAPPHRSLCPPCPSHHFWSWNRSSFFTFGFPSSSHHCQPQLPLLLPVPALPRSVGPPGGDARSGRSLTGEVGSS